MGRPPLGKVSMTGAERTRRYRARLRHTKPVTKSVSPDNAALVRELARARARIGELEMQLAQRDAELTRECSRRAAAEAKHSKPGDEDQSSEAAAAEPVGKKTFKLVLRLDSPNDNEVLAAARKIVGALKANGSDLRTLAAALETEWEKQQKAKPAPPPKIDFSEVEAAVKRYTADRTTVKYNAMWRALVAEMPALDDVLARSRDGRVTSYIHRYLHRLGFAGSSSGLTWHRT